MPTFNPKRIALLGLITLAILAIPLIAQRNRGVFDFVLFGALLFGAGLTYELIAAKGTSTRYKQGVGLAVITSLILLWMNGAVGIIGSEDNPMNMMYFGVIGVGIIGVVLARFQSRGMAYAAFAMAIAQMLVPIVAMIINDVSWTPGVAGIFVINAGFALLFVGA